MTKTEDTYSRLEAAASELGFDLFGIAKAGPLVTERQGLEEWLKKGYHAGMEYMARNIDKRTNPSQLVHDSKSVIVTALNYFHEYNPGDDAPLFARYAHGADYHKVLKDKLYMLAAILKEEIPSCSFRVFVDSAPVKENSWAGRAGLGWIGRNSLLINRDHGSYLLLGEIITDAELRYSAPFEADHCGSCRRCVETCPNGAINEDRTINASKCISYLTIEHKGEFNPDQEMMTGNHVFGCDICQEVCPWNKSVTDTKEPMFRPVAGIINNTFDDWEKISKDEYTRLFRESPLLRTGYEGFRRNLSAAAGSRFRT